MKAIKTTMKEKILSLLETQPTKWFASWELVKVNTPKGWLGNSADRVARDLAEEGKILRKQDGKYAYFSLIGQSTLF